MKKFFSLLLVSALILSLFCFVSCSDTEKDDPQNNYPISENTETLLAFTAPNDFTTVSLKTYLTELSSRDEISFTIEDGMITSVNGTENVSGTNGGRYWMIYSDLTEQDGVIYADPAYGTYLYGEKQLASCSYGAETMPVMGGYTYALVFEELTW